MFLPFVDHMLVELSDQPLQANGRFKAQHLMPRFVQHYTVGYIYGDYISDRMLL